MLVFALTNLNLSSEFSFIQSFRNLNPGPGGDHVASVASVTWCRVLSTRVALTSHHSTYSTHYVTRALCPGGSYQPEQTVLQSMTMVTAVQCAATGHMSHYTTKPFLQPTNLAGCSACHIFPVAN